ncbi:low molecular weight protein-tyrosine-phosphatase [[Clostridium] fimetarium]|uniref:protein-tyrosine-phosphatase n=1 Tax=[Clostridium] fimetarium TaxID=99656 RepID=A0A1I0PQA5_9FIRM|nr:low molecular weight protein-tyrosine-phosphatase [[Clostridium] fimetarium]SEW16473.1 protein-tyrosine phosphatase [[Clostridium] fimetarium]
MTKVLFVCLGNICRSPMAEYVFKDIVKKKGLEHEFFIASAATSSEEIGNPVHHGTRNKLRQYGISTDGKRAILLTSKDYQNYDYIIGMEQANIQNMNRILGQDIQNKIYRLLDFTKSPRDIADPWYTGNFDLTYNDVQEGCEALLEYIITNDLKKKIF